MKRLYPLLFFFGTTANAQQATPEDMGLPPAQEQAPSAPVAAAPVAAPVAVPPPDKEAQEEEKAHRHSASAKLGVGYEYARLWGVPLNAGRLRTGVGAQNDFSGHYMMVSILVGETENGRRVWDARLGYANDFAVLSVLRLGIELELGYLVLHRATLDSRQWAMGVGAGAHVVFDAIQFGERNRSALYIEGRFEGHVHFGGGVLWGPTISLGLRF